MATPRSLDLRPKSFLPALFHQSIVRSLRKTITASSTASVTRLARLMARRIFSWVPRWRRRCRLRVSASSPHTPSISGGTPRIPISTHLNSRLIVLEAHKIYKAPPATSAINGCPRLIPKISENSEIAIIRHISFCIPSRNESVSSMHLLA